ncbi:MAG: MFS transporter [Chloroflexota bacterium]
MNRIASFWNQARSAPRNIKYFMFTVLAYGIAVEGISAVLLNLYLLRLGYGTEFIGTLNSAGLLIFAIVSLPIGAVQRFTSRQMMVIGLILSVVGNIGLPLAPFMAVDPSFWLIAFRIIGMIGLSCYFVHQMPFSMEITSPEWHNRIMSATMATFSLAAFLGSWVGGLLPEYFSQLLATSIDDPWPFQVAMLISTALVIPAIFVSMAIAETPSVEEDEIGSPAAKTSTWQAIRPIMGLVVVIIIIRAIQTSGVGVVLTFSNVYFDDGLGVSTGRIGFISGFGRLIGVPLSLTIPWMMDRFGSYRFVYLGLGAIAVLMIPLALIQYWPIAAVSLIAINSMSGWRYLSFLTFSMAQVSEKQRSLMSGAGEMAIGIGFSTASFVGGYLIAWFGYRELFLYGSAMTMLGMILFWVAFRKRAAVPAKAAA